MYHSLYLDNFVSHSLFEVHRPCTLLHLWLPLYHHQQAHLHQKYADINAAQSHLTPPIRKKKLFENRLKINEVIPKCVYIRGTSHEKSQRLVHLVTQVVIFSSPVNLFSKIFFPGFVLTSSFRYNKNAACFRARIFATRPRVSDQKTAIRKWAAKSCNNPVHMHPIYILKVDLLSFQTRIVASMDKDVAEIPTTYKITFFTKNGASWTMMHVETSSFGRNIYIFGVYNRANFHWGMLSLSEVTAINYFWPFSDMATLRPSPNSNKKHLSKKLFHDFLRIL